MLLQTFFGYSRHIRNWHIVAKNSTMHANISFDYSYPECRAKIECLHFISKDPQIIFEKSGLVGFRILRYKAIKEMNKVLNSDRLHEYIYPYILAVLLKDMDCNSYEMLQPLNVVETTTEPPDDDMSEFM